MIVGLGTDLCNVARIARAQERSRGRFARKILSPVELSVFEERGSHHPLQGLRYLATRFCAKEALAKAMGTGFRWPLTWQSCAVQSSESGQPCWVFTEALAEWMQARNLRAHLSLSDEGQNALAFVVLEQTP